MELRRRIKHGDKREAMEVCIESVNLPNPVFAHQDSGMDIVQDVAAQMRHCSHNFAQDRQMPFGRREKAGTRLC